MMLFSGKKFLIAGFFVVLLVGIPLTLYFLQQQQQTQTRAQKSTTLSLTPESTVSTPIKRSVGDDVSIDVIVNPGTNLVSYVRLDIRYDSTKLQDTASATYVAEGSSQFPIIEGPVYSAGRIIVTQSVGGNPTNAIQQKPTKIGTIKLKALAATGTVPTQITLDQATEVLSLGEGDSGSEDVLQNTVPAFVLIEGATTSSPTPTVPRTTVPPTITKSSPTPTLKTTTTPTISTTPTPTTSGGTGTSTNQVPSCTALNLDRTPSGTAPFAIVFTAVGTDSDGTIDKVSFNFGDGPLQDLTSSGGIGSNTVSAQASHTYNNAGTYQASATLTDNKSGTSSATTCTQTITVVPEPTAAPGTGSGTAGTGAQPTIEPTGPNNFMVGLGAVVGILTFIGGLLFFAL